jgi:hypothetical protein
MAYPKTYGPEDAPASVRVLLHEVLPRLLNGNDPALTILRAQLREVTVIDVELSGVGFFAQLAVAPTLPTTDPPRIVGGDAEIVLSGVEHGAGVRTLHRQRSALDVRGIHVRWGGVERGDRGDVDRSGDTSGAG